MAKDKPLDWMLWQVEDGYRNEPPSFNLIQAIRYYTEKYGRVPNRAEVSLEWGQALKVPEGMRVTASPSVRPNQLLLAADPSLDEAAGPRSAAKSVSRRKAEPLQASGGGGRGKQAKQ